MKRSAHRQQSCIITYEGTVLKTKTAIQTKFTNRLVNNNIVTHHALIVCCSLFGIKYMKLSSSFIFFFTCMTESTFRFCITGAASVGRPVSLKEKHSTKIYCWVTNKVVILKACGHQLEAQTNASFNKNYICKEEICNSAF